MTNNVYIYLYIYDRMSGGGGGDGRASLGLIIIIVCMGVIPIILMSNIQCAKATARSEGEPSM